MVPFGKEGIDRIKKHRKMRQGKGFETYEQPVHIEKLLKEIPDLSKVNVLLECMSNLVGNEMYAPENSGLSRERLLNIILSEVKALAGTAANTVIVSNYFLPENEDYDEETLEYIRLVDEVNNCLRQFVDKCIEYKEGVWIEA